MKLFKFLNRKQKKEEFILIKREDRKPLFIPKEIHDIFENQKLKPLPSDSKMGMCTDPRCSLRFKEKFLSSLMDLDSMSCFMKNHQIETFDGVMDKKELEKWGDEIEYSAYKAGEMALGWLDPQKGPMGPQIESLGDLKGF